MSAAVVAAAVAVAVGVLEVAEGAEVAVAVVMCWLC